MQIGDKVAYSAEFLRSIADFSKKSADKRGIITRFEGDKNFMIAYIDGDFNIAVNVKNLRKVKKRVVIE